MNDTFSTHNLPAGLQHFTTSRMPTTELRHATRELSTITGGHDCAGLGRTIWKLVNLPNGALGFFGSLLEHRDIDDHSNTGSLPLVEACL
jgi:hypothetical protein